MFSNLRRGGRFGGRLLQANAHRLSSPLKLNLALTYWCQYKCKTCNIWRRRPTDELTTRELLTFVRENPNISWLDVTGGEIFLRDDIGEIFESITDSWRDLFLLHFPTNGFLTKKIVPVVEQLGRSGVPNVVVTISIDGDRNLNDDIRGITGGFDRQIETLNALRAVAGVRAVVGMTVSRFNVGQIQKTFDAVQALTPGLTMSDFHVNFAQVSEHYYGNAEDEVAAPKDEVTRELQWYRSQRGTARSPAAWLEGTFLRELETYLKTGTTPMHCHSLRSSCFIDPWGTVFPCITYTRPLGRLRDTGMRLAPIWENVETRTTQREIWNGSCPQCWTACEAYQSILGNLVRPRSLTPPASPPARQPAAESIPITLTGTRK